MKVEILYAAGCMSCQREIAALRSEASKFDAAIVQWHEIDVLQAVDYAVDLGVVTLPAVAINGRLEFACLPTPAQLLSTMRKRAKSCHGHRHP